MKKLVGTWVAFLIVLGVLSPLSVAFAGSAEDDANNVYEWTGSFDGGDGSTLNTSPNEDDGDADYSL